MTRNFFIYIDRKGKMPLLSFTPWQSVNHPYFVQYINDRPVKYHGPEDVISNNNKGVWCYASSKFIPLSSIKSV